MIDQKKLENVECFKYLGGVIINDGKCTREIKSRSTMATAAFNKKRLFSSVMELNLRKKVLQCYTWSIALYGAETITLQEIYQKHLKALKCGAGEGWRR
jgi:hypothetical protein